MECAREEPHEKKFELYYYSTQPSFSLLNFFERQNSDTLIGQKKSPTLFFTSTLLWLIKIYRKKY